MKRKLHAILIIMFSLAILTAGCGDGHAEKDKNAGSDSTKADSSVVKKDENEKKKEDTEDLVPVEVTTIERGTISDYILLSSNLETEAMADVYSRVQGLVENYSVEEGDFVKKGQLLAELEADEYVLAEQRAKINYQQQMSDYNRLKAMFETDLLSSEEFEKAKFQTEGLRIDWEQAKLNLDYTRITAPISGVIGERLIRIGDRIQPSTKLFSVINNQEMISVVYVPEKEMRSVRKGQAAEITSDHLAGERFEGWIKRVSPVVDPQTGTFKVTIGVKNKDNVLRSGMFVNTHIITSTHKNAVLIPKTAIVYENEYLNVFVVKDSIAHKIPLQPGFQDHEKIEALEGINEGDKVIVVGQSGLKDKTRVKVVSEKKITFASAFNKSKSWN